MLVSCADGTPSTVLGLRRRSVSEEFAMEIIGLIVAGLIIGLLGKFVAPGARDNTPLWLTLLCGIGGVLIGYYVSGALGVAATPGIDWMRWIISIILAAVLVVAASTLTGRNSRAVRR
jgi:uncharacterized membrane protein YeaQ/YmgE (transglycosylase-associated protein family)